MHDFSFPTTELRQMRREMADEATEFVKKLKADSKSKRVYNPQLKMIFTNDKSLVDWCLYVEHDDRRAFETLYQATKPIGAVRARLLEKFVGYRRAA